VDKERKRKYERSSSQRNVPWGKIRLRRRASVDAMRRTSVHAGSASTPRTSTSRSSPSSAIFPLPCRSALAGSRRCSSLLMTASCCRRKSAFCCFQRDSSTAVALTSAMESCFVNTCVTCWRRNEGDSVERRATREQGSANYFSHQIIYPSKCFFFSRGACGDHPPACRVYTQTK
jgi:hypothetical protein